ncbi:MAG: FHA domain-containing protein [Planctomycetota bacterium]|jgi:pSer/pThr/pTyr-binding forkhead associated (FHA) protein|nr:FHA domain-containing protein [Blastopirellula sp.]
MLQAKLVVVGGEVQSQEVKLKLPAVIGRGKEATLKVPLALISRRHCEIREREGRLYIRDLGSLNGTYVNNYKITAEQPLLPGELVTVGTITFRAEYQLNPQAQSQPAKKVVAQTGRGNQAAADADQLKTEAIDFTPLSSPRRTAPAAPQFDSTVAGTMSVSVSPGQPVKVRDSSPPSSSAPRPQAASSQPAIKQSSQPPSAAESGLVLDDFPLEVTPQKSISLSALDELAVTSPRQVSFIGDLNFGESPCNPVDGGVSIEVGSDLKIHQPAQQDGDSRLDSFLRGIERPAD